MNVRLWRVGMTTVTCGGASISQCVRTVPRSNVTVAGSCRRSRLALHELRRHLCAGLRPALHVREHAWDPAHALRLEVAAQHQLPALWRRRGHRGCPRPARAAGRGSRAWYRGSSRPGASPATTRVEIAGSVRWPSWSTRSSSQYTRSTSGSRSATCTISKTQSGASRSPASTIIARSRSTPAKPSLARWMTASGTAARKLDAMRRDSGAPRRRRIHRRRPSARQWRPRLPDQTLERAIEIGVAPPLGRRRRAPSTGSSRRRDSRRCCASRAQPASWPWHQRSYEGVPGRRRPARTHSWRRRSTYSRPTRADSTLKRARRR